MRNGLDQESFGSFFISLSGQQEVDSVAFFINGPVEIMPYSFDLDVSLIHSPAGADGFLPFSELNVQGRSIFNDPSLNCCVIDLNSSFSHEFFDVTVAQAIPQVPENCL